MVPLIAYAIVGPLRDLVLGPDSALAPMIVAALLPLAAANEQRSVALAGLLAILIAAIMLAGSARRLGIVTGAAAGIADPTGVRRLISMSRSESLVMIAAFLGVTILGVLPGIVVAVGLAILDFLCRAWNPYRAELDHAPPGTERVVLAAEPVTGIDTTALDELIQLDEWLERHGMDLVFAEMKGPVKDRLLRYGIGARFTPEHFHPTVSQAVRAFRREA